MSLTQECRRVFKVISSSVFLSWRAADVKSFRAIRLFILNRGVFLCSFWPRICTTLYLFVALGDLLSSKMILSLLDFLGAVIILVNRDGTFKPGPAGLSVGTSRPPLICAQVHPLHPWVKPCFT